MPKADETQQHRKIVRKRRGAEMVIHRAAAGEEFIETCLANRNRKRQTNG